MKTLGSVLLSLSLLASCENSRSKIDEMAKAPPRDQPVLVQAPTAMGAGAAEAQMVDRTGSLEDRVKRLEDSYARNAEALDFLNKVYAQQKAQQEQQEAGEPAPDAVFAVDIKDAVATGHVKGPNDALVTIVDVWDFACPYCQRASAALDELVKEYDGKVRLVFKHMVVHPQQVKDAHQASCAAAKQGKFYEFYKAFWDKAFAPYAAARDGSKLAPEAFLAWAPEVGLDVNKLKADMAGCQQQIEADQAELQKFRVTGTPAFFINGEFVGGALPKEAFKTIIDKKLAIAQASGVSGAEYYDKEIYGKGEKQFRSKKQPRPQ